MVELLPRPPPGPYSDAELVELERRLWNLSIFDKVQVERQPEEITIELREKWTLIPQLDYSSGRSWRDTYLALSATEYNFLGRGMLLYVGAWHQARGWNGSIELHEHNYYANRGSYGAALEYASAEYAFDDSPDAWTRLGGGGALYWYAPLRHGSYWKYQLSLHGRYERNVDAATPLRPPNGNYLHAELLGAWENLRWSDLAPSGVHINVLLSPGVFVHKHGLQPRMGIKSLTYAAHSFGPTIGVVSRFAAIIENRGNASFSELLGSYQGVRGLRDGVYHNWLQAVLNVELRAGWRFAERWAVQGVVFADAAAFGRIDAHGRSRGAAWATSAGFGARLVPTLFSELVLRFDLGRSVAPERGWFMQWGLSQYF